MSEETIHPRAKQDDGQWPEWVDEWVMPFLGDTALWPVLLAVAGHAVMIQTPLILLAWRTMNPAAFGPLAVLIMVTIHIANFERRHRKRYGKLTAALVIDWAFAVLLAAVFEYTGII